MRVFDSIDDRMCSDAEPWPRSRLSCCERSPGCRVLLDDVGLGPRPIEKRLLVCADRLD